MNAHLMATTVVQMACAKTMQVGFPVTATKNSLVTEHHAQVSNT